MEHAFGVNNAIDLPPKGSALWNRRDDAARKVQHFVNVDVPRLEREFHSKLSLLSAVSILVLTKEAHRLVLLRCVADSRTGLRVVCLILLAGRGMQAQPL